MTGRERQSVSLAVTSSSTASVCFRLEESPFLEQFVDPLPILYHINVSDGLQHVLKAFKTNQVRLFTTFLTSALGRISSRHADCLILSQFSPLLLSVNRDHSTTLVQIS
jgi:hypothetical protein